LQGPVPTQGGKALATRAGGTPISADLASIEKDTTVRARTPPPTSAQKIRFMDVPRNRQYEQPACKSYDNCWESPEPLASSPRFLKLASTARGLVRSEPPGEDGVQCNDLRAKTLICDPHQSGRGSNRLCLFESSRGSAPWTQNTFEAKPRPATLGGWTFAEQSSSRPAHGHGRRFSAALLPSLRRSLRGSRGHPRAPNRDAE
jgi:hypothetical protein